MDGLHLSAIRRRATGRAESGPGSVLEGGDLMLVVVPDGDVHSVLQVTRLDRVFRIFGSEDEATAAANGEAN